MIFRSITLGSYAAPQLSLQALSSSRRPIMGHLAGKIGSQWATSPPSQGVQDRSLDVTVRETTHVSPGCTSRPFWLGNDEHVQQLLVLQ